jgi:hypothetical protein
MDIKTLKNKIILFEGNLWVIDQVTDSIVIMSTLESNAEILELDLNVLNDMGFDFEYARLQAVNLMNQTRYYDNSLSKEKDNVVM